MVVTGDTGSPFQYPIRGFIVRSRKVSKPRDLHLELHDRSAIWQAPRQQCCRCACQISKPFDKFNYQYHGFYTSRDLTIWRLIGYWNGDQVSLRKNLIIKVACHPWWYGWHLRCLLRWLQRAVENKMRSWETWWFSDVHRFVNLPASSWLVSVW